MAAVDLIHLGVVFLVRQVDENLCVIREDAPCRLKHLREVAPSGLAQRGRRSTIGGSTGLFSISLGGSPDGIAIQLESEARLV